MACSCKWNPWMPYIPALGKKDVLLGVLLLLHSLCCFARLPPSMVQMGANSLSQTPFAKMSELVLPFGYPLEEHFVTTHDGYILRMFRIPHGVNASSHHAATATAGPKPVVHLQHGLLGASSDFALNGPGYSLPFILADAGYDVWFGNVRGNHYSRNHTKWDILNPLFWAFSWDEIAAADLPAMVEYELAATGHSKVSYIGHSQGTTIMMAALSSNPGFAALIQVAILLAPVTFVTHVDSVPLVTLAKLNTDEIFILLGLHEFMPSSEILSKLDGQMCSLEPKMCINLLAAICGYNPDNIDMNRLPTYMKYTPSGTSVQNMAHWSQAVRATSPNTMPYFDYGIKCQSILGTPRPCNQKVYDSFSAPTYNLSAITVPLALFTGGKDRLSDPVDLELLLEALPHRHILQWHEEPAYEHLDFVWGLNAHTRIYGDVLRLLKKTTPPSSPVMVQQV
eukprot:jgi/Chrzof1/7462/Cz02g24260.t1_LIP1[v5.2]